MVQLIEQRPAPPSAVGPVPGPRGLPILGNVLDFGRDQLDFFTRHVKTHGDLVAIDFAGWPGLIVSDMDAIEHILVRNSRNFIKNRLTWRQVTALFGQGLLTSEGEYWQRQRRLAAPAFAGRQLLAYDRDIVELAVETAAQWQDGSVIDIHPPMMGLSLRVAAKAFFDSDIRQDIEAMEHILDELIKLMEQRFRRPFLIPDVIPLPGNLRYRRAIRAAEAVTTRLIAERRRTGVEGRTDLLSRLMAATDEDGGMSDTALRDESLTMLLAGHETTALSMSWAFHLLGRHPRVQQRLVDEVDAVLAGRLPTSADISSLPWTEAVITEAMRLFPPAWVIGRESLAPFEICGRTFPAETTIFICQWVIHRDARWFEEPLAFRPERWLDGGHATLPRFAYMPFGGGPRICIGQRFAMIEAVLMLATLMQRFTVEWQQDRPITPFPSITLRPGGGVWVRLSAREAGAARN